MKLVSSYAVELRHINKYLRDTTAVYRAALAFLIEIVDREWGQIAPIQYALSKQRHVETLIHTTKKNTAKYDFDARFYKMPSYMRRAVISDAIGAVSSYRSNLAHWTNSDKKGKKPTLRFDRYTMPTFYRENMYLEGEDDYTAQLKLYVRNDWVWVTVRLLPTDVRYLQKYWSHCEASAPTLEKRHGKYFLRFAFTEDISLNKVPIQEQTVCAVDLGLNHDAVCSILRADGTILARKFINFPSDKDRLYTVVNRIKRFQREHGSKDVGSRWEYAQRLNKELGIKIADAIVRFASEQHVDCLVFEHLSMQGKKKGSRKERLHLWRKNTIQGITQHKAHRLGIHISRVCAWGTSQLAFDGSGKVERDKDNYSLCTFSNGKRYNCDLSASYNIGARYFIREILKSLPATARSRIVANVPDVERRTSCTYATHRLLVQEMAA